MLNQKKSLTPFSVMRRFYPVLALSQHLMMTFSRLPNTIVPVTNGSLPKRAWRDLVTLVLN